MRGTALSTLISSRLTLWIMLNRSCTLGLSSTQHFWGLRTTLTVKMDVTSVLPSPVSARESSSSERFTAVRSAASKRLSTTEV